MKNWSIISLLSAIVFTSLIVRHDVPDKSFIDLAKNYPQICHLPMGEGTLIHSSWVLTAGHIGRDLNRDMNSGYSPSVKCNGHEYPVELVVVHPDFEDSPDGVRNDIALVKIKGSIVDVVPADIYSGKNEMGKRITIVGMGDIGNGNTGPQKWDKVTRAATNTVDGADDQWINFSFDAPGSKDCTEMEGISGPGDSGGPAFYEEGNHRYIIGISSHQMSENGKGRYCAREFYSRVSSYADWISTSLGKK